MGVRDEGDLLSAAVSPLVAGALAGPATPRRVLAAFATCVYVDLGAHDRVLALLTCDALHLPIGLRLAVPASGMVWGVEPGDEVAVGAGRVVLRHPRGRCRAAEPSVARQVPRPSCRTADVCERLPEPGLLGELTHDLTTKALMGRPLGDAVLGLVGAGRGLTPSGDDALCGVLLALRSVDHPDAARALARLRAELVPVLQRTTSLSAALLVAAASGYAVPDVVRLVTLRHGGTTGRHGLARQRSFRRPQPCSAIGHSSGRDLLSGVSGALGAMAGSLSPLPAGPPTQGGPPCLTTSSGAPAPTSTP